MHATRTTAIALLAACGGAFAAEDRISDVRFNAGITPVDVEQEVTIGGVTATATDDYDDRWRVSLLMMRSNGEVGPGGGFVSGLELAYDRAEEDAGSDITADAALLDLHLAWAWMPVRQFHIEVGGLIGGGYGRIDAPGGDDDGFVWEYGPRAAAYFTVEGASAFQLGADVRYLVTRFEDFEPVAGTSVDAEFDGLAFAVSIGWRR